MKCYIKGGRPGIRSWFCPWWSLPSRDIDKDPSAQAPSSPSAFEKHLKCFAFPDITVSWKAYMSVYAYTSVCLSLHICVPFCGSSRKKTTYPQTGKCNPTEWGNTWLRTYKTTIWISHCSPTWTFKTVFIWTQCFEGYHRVVESTPTLEQTLHD